MSERCFIVEGVRYAPMNGVRVDLVTISQLSTFGIHHLSGRSLVTRPTQPWDTPALYGRTFKHVTFYYRRLWEYSSVWIFVSVRSITVYGTEESKEDNEEVEVTMFGGGGDEFSVMPVV